MKWSLRVGNYEISFYHEGHRLCQIRDLAREPEGFDDLDKHQLGKLSYDDLHNLRYAIERALAELHRGIPR